MEDAKILVRDSWEIFASGLAPRLEQRQVVLKKLESVLIAKQEEILAALAADLGKPGMEAYLSEYYFLLQELRLVRKKMKSWLKKKRVGSPFYFQPCRSWIERKPFGVVLVMAPWNYPFQLSLSPVIAAVAAGNLVVLKPSEMATESERVIGEIIEEAFDGLVRVVTGGPEVAQSLLEEDFDFIFFTGSTRVGREVAVKAAETLTPTLMELGGKCPCVVDEGVDLKVAARRILAGKFFNAGQTCFAPDFVVVAESMRGAFVKACEEVMAEVPWADEMARIISRKHFERIRGALDGTELIFGEDNGDTCFLAPRVIPNANWDHPAMKEEIFGPVLPVLGYSDEPGLMARLAEMENPLAVYCFSKRNDFVDEVATALPSGSLCVNDTMKQFSQLRLPLGGVGKSGYGRYRGRHGVEAFSYEKSVAKRYYFGRDYFEMLPPYEKAFKWMRKFLK